MKIVWDELKQLEDMRKHGFDFAALDLRFFEQSAIIPATSNRSKALGVISDRILVVIFFKLGREGISVISMRPADRNERKQYEQALLKLAADN